MQYYIVNGEIILWEKEQIDSITILYNYFNTQLGNKPVWNQK